MNEDVLVIKLEEIHKVHEKIEKCFLLPNIDGELKREYRQKTGQYDNMIQALDLMKAEASSEEAKARLIEQQLVIIKKWVEFEFDIVNKI